MQQGVDDLAHQHVVVGVGGKELEGDDVAAADDIESLTPAMMRGACSKATAVTWPP